MTNAEAIEAIHEDCKAAVDTAYDYHQDNPDDLDAAINAAYNARDAALKKLRGEAK